MRHILRIPTSQQYAYIEVEFEGTSEEALDLYDELTRKVKNGAGIDKKLFNELFDEYVITGTAKNGAEVWEQMSEFQQSVFRELKKSFTRIKSK